MIRYFYKDPLAAAWMANHFGMQFMLGGDSRSYCFQDIITDYSDEDGCFRHPYASRWYIHPDSLHLLEPNELDLICAAEELHKPGTFDTGEIACGLYRIIQRDTKAFHWPESEAA